MSSDVSWPWHFVCHEVCPTFYLTSTTSGQGLWLKQFFTSIYCTFIQTLLFWLRFWIWENYNFKFLYLYSVKGFCRVLINCSKCNTISFEETTTFYSLTWWFCGGFMLLLVLHLHHCDLDVSAFREARILSNSHLIVTQ